MKIREVMTTNVVTASPDTTLEEIATMMKAEDTGAIPVAEEDELLGIITDRDIVLRCVAEGRDASECTAEEILTEEVEVVDPETDVEEALEIMGRRQIRRLPVVDNGELVGMVSIGDLAVKQGDEQDTGEALKDVSRGVKQSRRMAEPARNMQHEMHDEESSGGSQGIANHDLAEEERRQQRVVSIRPDANALPRDQKKPTKRRAS